MSIVADDLWENIAQSGRAPICAFDTEYRLIGFNQALSDEFFRIYQHRVALGDVFPDLFLPEEEPIIRGFMARALAGESYVVVGKFGNATPARRYWELSYAPLRDKAGTIFGAFHQAVDISARLRTEAELTRSQEALRQSQKMEAVGQLTGGLAHDFNNLLAVISGSLELAERNMLKGRINDIERFLAAAQTASKRATALTHRLLAFSRRQTLDPKPTDINNLIAGMDELVRRTVGPQVTVEVVGAAGLWSTLVDPNQLENALLNLAINARDAMPNGGRLTIETANSWLDAPTDRKRDITPGKYVVMSVRDTGCGMTPEVIAKAFDPFFTTKPLGQGTGLGLSMIYGFAQQSGGQARIFSKLGHGTMVSIYLPRYTGEASVLAEPVMDLAAKVEPSQTVLVVDDEPGVRMLVVEVLEQLGYDALEADDGPSALKILESNARIDLLVSDVGLPGGMNGRQVADAGRVVRPRLKTLFITGYAENAAVGNGLLEVGMAVMTKPFALDALADRITEMIAG